MTGSSNLGDNHIAAAISDILRNTGVNAGIANLPKLLRIEPASAVNEIKKIYGKVMVRSLAARSALIGSSTKPGAKIMIITGAAIIPTAVIMVRITAKVPLVCAINCRKGLSPCSLNSARTGIKACENAPSAKSRLKKLGILKATKKTSAPKPAPNILAMTISLTKPSIRDKKVITLTTAVDLKSFSLMFYSQQGYISAVQG